MDRYVISGHGWSGSSALIDYLNCHQSPDYVLIPGELDDFRAPGTMREALTGGMPTSSHRSGGLKWVAMLFLRGCVPDVLWPMSIKGGRILRRSALDRARQLFFENRAFKKTAKLLARALSDDEKKVLLQKWMDTTCKYYHRPKKTARAIFIEQFFLFDDDAALYDWFNFFYFINLISFHSIIIINTCY